MLKGLSLMRMASIMLAIGLSGCVSMGTNYSEAAVDRLQPGMPKSAVIELLGKPSSVVSLSDGRQQLGWLYSQGSMFGAKARSLTLPFGPDGRLLQVPGGPAVDGPPAVATTSTARVGAFSSNIETSAAATLSASSEPAALSPSSGASSTVPGSINLGSGVFLVPAKTPSGYCIKAPPGYQGTGSVNKPSVTNARPKCS